MILQEKLYALRSRAGLTQEALAEVLGVSRQAVAKWEQGISVPDIGNIVALARAFQVTVDSLVKPEMDCGMRMLAPEKADEDALIGFLLRAKKATYAGHGAEAESPCRPLSHHLIYAEGDFLYFDTYLGGERFAGEEAV
jgi:transcriptional regulator with XRE-family HTH domain